MELKINDYQIPGPIVFNFDELKTGLTERRSSTRTSSTRTTV